MIFKSKTLVNGTPAWAVDTDTQTVKHINPKTGEIERYSFHSEHIERHLKFCEEYRPERLQRLVDEGEIYRYLDELDIKVTDAVNAQVQRWIDESEEYQIANEKGDLYALSGIANNFRVSAKEGVFRDMVFV